MILAVILLLLIFFSPGEAFAWGMGVHLEIGSRLLTHVADFSPDLRALLAAHPNDFLYGCLSADITVGKKYTHYLRNCHSWTMGKKILTSAKSDREKSCAWGYMVHLAADCVAHSYFIPYKTVRTFNTTLHNHAYWEMRIESRLPPQIWTLAHEVAAGDNLDNDRMLRSVLARTLFSFGTNKRIFNSIILLSQIERWQKGLQLVDNRSRWILEDDDLADYMEMAYQAAHSLLTEGDASPYLKADPTGERALRAASALRRNFNHLWLEGKLTENAAEKQMVEVKNLFRAGITQPEKLLDLVSDR